jgi:hypothetical protein
MVPQVPPLSTDTSINVTQGDTNESPSTRNLLCKRCDGKIDVKFKQLEVKDGFRLLDCPNCNWRGRAQHLKCECGTKWFLCSIHRPDPPTHQSRKPPIRKTTKQPKQERTLYSNRKAPKIRGSDAKDRLRQKNASKKNLHSHHVDHGQGISPEHAAFLLTNWKRRKLESHSARQADTSGGGDRGPSTPVVVVPRSGARVGATASSPTQTTSDNGLHDERPQMDNRHSTSRTSSSIVDDRLRPGSSYSGPEVLLDAVYIDSGRLPLACLDPGRLPASTVVSTFAANKDGPHPPTASKACLPAGGRAGSAYNGETSTRATTRTADPESIPPSKRACLSRIELALQHDSSSKDRARKSTASRRTRLLTPITPFEPPADERVRSRSR